MLKNNYEIKTFINFGKFRIRKNEIFHNTEKYYTDRFAMFVKDLKSIPDANLIKNNITESIEYNIKMIEKSFYNKNQYQEVKPVYNVKVEYWNNMTYFSNKDNYGLVQSRYCALSNNIKNKKYWLPEIDSKLPLIITNDQKILIAVMKIDNIAINQEIDNYYFNNHIDNKKVMINL